MEKLPLPEELGKKMIPRDRLGAWYRGVIVGKFTDIEFLMEMVISTYFCDDVLKANEFRHRLLCSKYMIFEAKKITVEFIIKKHFEKEFHIKYPKLIPVIVDLQDKRNKLGHRKILTDEDRLNKFDGDLINFENFETESHEMVIDHLPMTQDILAKTINKMGECIDQLNELLTLVNSKANNNKAPL